MNVSLSRWSWNFAHILSLETSPEDVALFKRKEKRNMSFTVSGKFLGSKSEKFKVLHLRSGQLRNVNELGILASLLNCTYIVNRPKGLLS